MAFISELTGRPVTDIDGKRVGVLRDVVARPLAEGSHPVVSAIVVGGADGDRAIPYLDLAALLSAAIPLRRPLAEIAVPPGYGHPVQDVMDKQIWTQTARIGRVNDIELLRVNIRHRQQCGYRDARHHPSAGRRSRPLGHGGYLDFSPERSPGSSSNPGYDQSMRLVPSSNPICIRQTSRRLFRIRTGEHAELLENDLKRLADVGGGGTGLQANLSILPGESGRRA
jgi:sporulation protein YlmC with PRC-barrel domain